MSFPEDKAPQDLPAPSNGLTKWFYYKPNSNERYWALFRSQKVKKFYYLRGRSSSGFDTMAGPLVMWCPNCLSRGGKLCWGQIFEKKSSNTEMSVFTLFPF